MSKETTTKDVTTKTQAQLPVDPSKYSWGPSETVTQDILIPKILLMQGTSQFVTQELAEVGHIVNSVSKDKLGSAREKDFAALKIIPLRIQNVWMEYEVLGNKLQLKNTIPRNNANDNLPLEYLGDKNVKMRRDKTILLFCLLEKDLTEDFPMPYVVTFKRTSFHAGKAISTHFAKCDMARQLSGGKAGKPPYATTFTLAGTKKSNEQNTWYAFDWMPDKSATSEQGLELASYWEKTIQTASVRIDESDEETVETAANPPGGEGFKV